MSDTPADHDGFDVKAFLSANWGKCLVAVVLVILLIATAGNAIFNNGDDTATEAPTVEMVNVPGVGQVPENGYLNNSQLSQAFLFANSRIDSTSAATVDNATNTAELGVMFGELINTTDSISVIASDGLTTAEAALTLAASNTVAIVSNEVKINANTASINKLRSRLFAVAEKNNERAGVYKDVLETQGLSPVRVGPFDRRKTGEKPEVLVEVTDAMKPGLNKVIGFINRGEYKVLSIRGYADKTPIANETVKAMFADNNKLAVARAQKVLNYLNDELKKAIPPSVVVRFSAEQDRFGGVKDNNRRVIIVLQKISK